MSVSLSREDHNTLVDLIAFLPELRIDEGRHTILTGAFQDYPNARRMIARINFSGDAIVFTTQMINLLTTFGQIEKDVEALGVLIQHIADPALMIVGKEEQAFLQKLIIGYQMMPNIPTKEALAAATKSATGGSEPVAPADDCYIFISYARPNVDVANQIADGLQAAGYSFFQDIRVIESGDRWSQKIEEALWKAGRMVLLLSKASMPYRKEVEREWFFFDMKGKPIHTVLVEDCDINSRLIQVNYIDARTNVAGAVQQLIDKLNKECKKS